MKFKVGDKVRVVAKNGADCEFKIGTIGTVTYINNPERTYPINVEDENGLEEVFKEEELELYLEDNIKTKKTFREIIANIKENEVWENKDARVKRIYINDYGNLTFEGENYTFSMNYSTCIGLDDVYELKIIGCPFEKAFREYEQGKVIGSNYGYRYKKIGDKDYVYDKDLNQWVENEESFTITEIREEWFVEG